MRRPRSDPAPEPDREPDARAGVVTPSALCERHDRRNHEGREATFAARMRAAISMRRAFLLLPWVALAIVATLVQGLPGHTVPFFSGDLGYHLATARTMTAGDLNGAGPYAGLPSYYGGVFPLVIALFIRLGADATTSVAVLSWFEPVAWLLGGSYLARTLWPRSLQSQLTFCAFLLLGAGIGLSRTQQWVDAPNISGQVYWPLYPRDVALILLLFSTGLALRGRWLFGAVLVAIGIATEAQIGPIALVLAVAAILLQDRTRSGRLRAVAVIVIAGVGSSWWWVPRVIWAARYGFQSQLQVSSVFFDLSLTPATVWHAYGLLLVPAILGVAAWVNRPRSSYRTLAGLWLLGAGVLVAVAVIHPSAFLTVRRALVLASLPILIAAVEGIGVIAHVLRRQPVPSTLASAIAALCVLLASAPTVAATRRTVLPIFGSADYGLVSYPSGEWDRVWRRLRQHGGAVLTAPSDAVMAWWQSGRPQLWMVRPGSIKLGFDVGSATGWPEAARQAAVEAAFVRGPAAVCNLAMSRDASDVLLRSMPGYLGVIDLSGGLTGRMGSLRRPATTVDRGSVVVAAMPPGTAVNIASVTTETRVLQVWQSPPSGSGEPNEALTLVVDGRAEAPDQVVHDGAALRTTFVLPHGRANQVQLVNRTGLPRWFVRVVGYVPSDLATSSPASVVSTKAYCGSVAR